MTHCATCQYWNADPEDNGMGCCTGIPGRPDLVEINPGFDQPIEFYTHATFGCEIGVDKTIPQRLS